MVLQYGEKGCVKQGGVLCEQKPGNLLQLSCRILPITSHYYGTNPSVDTILVIQSLARISGTLQQCLRTTGERYKTWKTGESICNVSIMDRLENTFDLDLYDDVTTGRFELEFPYPPPAASFRCVDAVNLIFWTAGGRPKY